MKTKIIALLIALVVLAGVASAGLLTYYGTITGTATDVKQSIVIDGLSVSDVQQTYDIEEGMGGNKYTDTFTIKNRANISGYIAFGTNSDEAVTTRYLAEVRLHGKDASNDYSEIGSMEAYLTYQLDADEFNYDFTASGLEEGIDYTLIYYKDNVDGVERYDPTVWGGAGGKVISTGLTSPSGDLMMHGSVNMAGDIPYSDDWNTGDHYDVNFNKADYGDCNNGCDDYDMRTGAKIWLVPADTMTGGNLPVQLWRPDRFVFETDLINYDDSGDGVGLRIGANSEFKLIIENTFAINTVPGTYIVTTTIAPVV